MAHPSSPFRDSVPSDSWARRDLTPGRAMMPWPPAAPFSLAAARMASSNRTTSRARSSSSSMRHHFLWERKGEGGRCQNGCAGDDGDDKREETARTVTARGRGGGAGLNEGLARPGKRGDRRLERTSER